MIRKSSARSPIYADYQASTPVDRRVAESLGKYFAEQTSNPHSDDHAMGWEAAAHLEDAQRRIAIVINCDPDEVIFTSGATEANNLALQGLARRATQRRRRILVSAVEHKSVLAAAQVSELCGCSFEILPVNDDGRVCLSEVERRLDGDVLLVSIMTVNNEIGSVQPVVEIGKLCERAGCWFHTDAVQALTHDSIDVGLMNAHAVSLSAHKLYGPQGIGALYVRRDVQPHLQAIAVGGGQQHGLRSGTVPVPLCRGFADAIDFMHGPEARSERDRVRLLRDRFVEQVLTLGAVRLNGPRLSERHPGNANLCFVGKTAKDILDRVQPHLAASTGSACTSGVAEASHVLIAIGLSNDDAEASIRFSFGRYSLESDVDRAVELLGVALQDSARKTG